jgi:outer membrane protein assembly factor BamD (BamD/ComL family)
VLGECFLAQGDYAGARRHADYVLQRFPGQADDRALHLLGLVLMHPDNPRGDRQEGAEVFRRLVADYPDSPLVVDARTWLAFVADLEESKHTVQALQTQNRRLEERLSSEQEQRRKLEKRLQQMKAVDLTMD